MSLVKTVNGNEILQKLSIIPFDMDLVRIMALYGNGKDHCIMLIFSKMHWMALLHYLHMETRIDRP